MYVCANMELPFKSILSTYGLCSQLISQGGQMDVQFADIWTAAGVLIGFQVTSFVWRISREVEVGKKGDITWLPPADILNLLSMVVTMVGVFILPILDLADLNFMKLSFGLAVLLLVSYPFALAGHYDMYNSKTPRSFLYFPQQEKVVVAIATILVIAYLVIVDEKMMNFNELITIFSIIITILSLIAFIIAEYVRKPSIEFLEPIDSETGKKNFDKPTLDSENYGRMFYHLKVKNKEPIIFSRDAALQSKVRVRFCDIAKNIKLAEITAHWTNQIDPGRGDKFDEAKIPTCQRMDIGFRAEDFDILVKFDNDEGFYVADPWIVYHYPEKNPEQEWKRLKLNAKKVKIIVEIESINLGKIEKAEYLLKNNGRNKEDIEIEFIKKY